MPQQQKSASIVVNVPRWERHFHHVPHSANTLQQHKNKTRQRYPILWLYGVPNNEWAPDEKKTINKTKSPTATTHCQIATSHYYKLLSIGGGLDCRVTTGEHLDVLGPEVTTNPDGRLGS